MDISLVKCTGRYKIILSDNGPSGQAVKRSQPVYYFTWDTKPVDYTGYLDVCKKSRYLVLTSVMKVEHTSFTKWLMKFK